jgi:hypothetical protein
MSQELVVEYREALSRSTRAGEAILGEKEGRRVGL